MMQVESVQVAPPRTVSFHRVQEGLWHSADGRQQLRLTGPQSCVLRRRLSGGRTEVLVGLLTPTAVVLRDARGHITEGVVTRGALGDRMTWGRLRAVPPPPSSPLDSMAVAYSPNTHRFESRDGRLHGRFVPENGRLLPTDAHDTWQGLVGPGVAVLVDDAGHRAVLRVTPGEHSLFLLEGASRFFPAGDVG